MGKKEIKIPITPRHSYVACFEKAHEVSRIVVPGQADKSKLVDPADLFIVSVGEDVKDLKAGDQIALLANANAGWLTYTDDEGVSVHVIEQHRIMAIVNKDTDGK